MGALGKALAMLAAIAALYIVAAQLGIVKSDLLLFPGTLDRLRAIDAQYGIGEERPAPLPESAAEYEQKIRGLRASTPVERNVIQMKIELVKMQEALREFSRANAQMNSAGECAPAAEVSGAYNGALSHALKAIALGEKLGAAPGFEYLGGRKMANYLNAAIASMNESMDKYYVVC